MIAAWLEDALNAEAASDRRAAAEEIGESGDPEALRMLIARLGNEGSRAVKEAILRGLAAIRICPLLPGKSPAFGVPAVIRVPPRPS